MVVRAIQYSTIDVIVSSGVAGLLGVLYGRTLAPGLTWANAGADGGDFVSAAASLGVAHPPGYPTYVLLARLMLVLPFGEPAWRVNLLSALAAVIAALVVYQVVRVAAHDQGFPAAPTRAAAAIAALGLGVSPLLWSQAVITEVYAPTAACAAVLVLLISRALASAPQENAPPVAVLAGLMLGIHATLAIAVLAWLLVELARRQPEKRLGSVRSHVAWFGVGLLVYVYLPLSASGRPPVNWGDPRDLEGFWWMVSGQLYQGYAFGLAPEHLPGRVQALAGLLLQQYGLSGALLGLLGLVYARGRRLALVSALVALAYALFAIGYDTTDSDAYLLPASVIFAGWIGLGCMHVWAWAVRWHILAGPLILLVAALLVLGRAPWTLHTVDASGDRRAIDYTEAVMERAPPDAIVLTTTERETFPLWYNQHALGRRPDLAVVATTLLHYDWYRDTLRSTYPSLEVPDHGFEAPLSAFQETNRSYRPVCVADVVAGVVCPAAGP